MKIYKISEVSLELPGLAAEARKYDSFEEFEKAFLYELKHGTYWHITNDPNFTINKNKGPKDMSSMGIPSVSIGQLMVTSDLKRWADHYMNRQFAALIDMSNVPKNLYYQVNRGFGNEFMVTDPSQAKVISVMSIKVALEYSEMVHAKLPQNPQKLENLYNEVWKI